MARKFKTSKKARTTYKVYSVNEQVVAEFIPGQDGITEVHIQLLHEMDDEEYNQNRREAYHCPVHYMAYSDGDSMGAEERNGILGDMEADPAQILEKALMHGEFRMRFRDRWRALSEEQRKLILRKANGETNVSIAAELGISEAAIRKQIKRIRKRFLDLR